MILLVDGDSFLNVSLNVVKAILNKDTRPGQGTDYFVSDILDENKVFLKQISKVTFKDFVLSYFSSIVSPYKNTLDYVFFTFDSYSWRKQYLLDSINSTDFAEYKPFAEKDLAYKAGRKPDPNRFLFFDYFKAELLPHLVADCNLYPIRVNGAEGDDVIALLSDKFVDSKIVIWSGDKDLHQLLRNGNGFVIQAMPKMMKTARSIVTLNGFESNPVTASNDFFDMDSNILTGTGASDIIQILVKKNYQHVTVSSSFIFDKIICGDKGDNVIRLQGITGKRAEELVEYINANFDSANLHTLDFEDFFTKVMDKIKTLIKVKKGVNSEVLFKQLEKHLRINTALVTLNKTFIPTDVQKLVDQYLTDHTPKKFNSSAIYNLQKTV